ncbi:MAG: M48 family metalloprotease [Geminicoccaceae bacterium]
MPFSLRRLSLGLVTATAVLAASARAEAATLIRDAEIEETVHQITDPVFEAAGLDVEAIDVYLLRDPVLNAFVSGGQNLFINTGLIQRTTDPAQLRGVVAHETGHIAGGHLARAVGARETAMVQTLLGAALGLAAALAGAPQLGTAIIAGGATVGQRGLLAFSRTQEQAADQAAVTYLGRIGESPEGLKEFFDTLERQNLRISGTGGNVYLRTHPLTQDRILFMEDQVERSPYRGKPLPPELIEAHKRMVAKLDGFMLEPAQAERLHPSDSVADRYARAIALYRTPDLPAALKAIDELIALEPQNPWFYELKGQMLFENGKLAEAVGPYRDALRYRPSSALLRLGLARALMEQTNPAGVEEAASLLAEAARLEPRNPTMWRFLGIAEGKLGREGASAMALAEGAILAGNKTDAQLYVRRAQQFVTADDPDWIRLQDQLRAVEELPDPQPRRRT